MVKFTGNVVLEGSKGKSTRISLPTAYAETLEKEGMVFPGWVRITIDDVPPFFTWARRPPSRHAVDLGLPIRFVPVSMAKEQITVIVENAEPYRARSWTDLVGFDWLPYVDEKYLPVETLTGQLQINSRYEEPFVMKRVTEPVSTYRLLGWYQAEGSKSENAPDFTFTTSNVEQLTYYTRLVESVFGIPRERLSLEVLRSKNQTPAEACELYEKVEIQIVAERLRSGKGEHAGCIHVKKSQPLVLAVKQMLKTLLLHPVWPTKAAAKEYALGWLDGDGGITIYHHTGSVALILAGYKDEQIATLEALEKGFGWTLPKGAFGTPRDGTARMLSVDQMAELAYEGGFSRSLARARLIWALDERLGGWGVPPPQSRTTLEQWQRARSLFDEHLVHEAVWLKTLPEARKGFSLGIKGLPYPKRQKG